MFARRTIAAAVVGGLLLIGVAACSGDEQPGREAPLSAESSDRNLRGVCPDPVVIQTAWNPESEHGGLYQLVGPGYLIDANKFTVTGPLVSGAANTGVKVQIRAGGPAIGFRQVSQQLYADKAITLGQISTDEAIRFSRRQPSLAVVAPLEVSPYMIMWDPGTYPEFNTITDIGQTGTKVLYHKGDIYMEYLIGTGILRGSQVDGSYDGSPATFVRARGKVAQAGVATSEPYTYLKELPEWGKPVEIALISDTGYAIYPQALSIRAGEKGRLASCLRRLVPIIQQAQVDFINKPEETNQLVLKLVEKYHNGGQYSPGRADFAIRQMKALSIVGNGPNHTLGDFDLTRVQQVIGMATPIFRAQNTQVKDGIQAADVVTNEFIDERIGLTAR
jgi:hypothetical protein